MSLSEKSPFGNVSFESNGSQPLHFGSLLVGLSPLDFLPPIEIQASSRPYSETERRGHAEMADSASASTLVASFIAAGIPKAKAESTAKNGKLAAILAQLINDNDIVDANRNPKQGNLLLHLAGIEQDQQFGRDDSNLLAKGIYDGRLQSLDQVNGARD